MKDVLRKIVDKAIEFGAEYADARYERIFSTNITFSNDKIEKISTGMNEGIGIRVLANGAFSFLSSNILNIDDLLRQLKDSVKSAKFFGEKRKEKIKLADVKTVKDKVVVKSLNPPQEYPLEDKVSFISELVKNSRSLDTHIVNATAIIADSHTYKILVTSEGTEIRYEIPRVYFGLDVVAFEAGRSAWFGIRKASPRGYEFIKKFSPEDISKEVVEKALKMLKAKPAPAGRFTVVADNDLTGVFIHEAFGHACEGDIVAAGESILKGKLGQKVGSELVTVHDDSTIPNGWGSLKYDDEGVPTQKRVLVEKGYLKTFITNRESAYKLDLPPNGGGRAQNYSFPPLVRMSNTYIQPGDYSKEELFEDIKYGVYLLGSRGGQVDTAKGTFQFNAKEAYLIEKGEITTPLLDVSLSGYTLEVLSNVDAIGKDFDLWPGFCGKGGQAVPAGTGGPHIRIKNAIVGGKK